MYSRLHTTHDIWVFPNNELNLREMEEYISQHPQCLKNGCNISLDQI